MGVEIPIGELSDFQIYKIIYDKNTSSYLEIEPVARLYADRWNSLLLYYIKWIKFQVK